MRSKSAIGLSLIPMALLYSSPASARQAADWPMFNRDLAGTRYSPLTQINAANVGKLTKAWAYAFNREGKTIAGDLGIGGVSQNPFDWGLPNLSFVDFGSLTDTNPQF